MLISFFYLINCQIPESKYFIINFAMAKLMEMEQADRNKVALYLFNNIKIQ